MQLVSLVVLGFDIVYAAKRAVQVNNVGGRRQTHLFRDRTDEDREPYVDDLREPVIVARSRILSAHHLVRAVGWGRNCKDHSLKFVPSFQLSDDFFISIDEDLLVPVALFGVVGSYIDDDDFGIATFGVAEHVVVSENGVFEGNSDAGVVNRFHTDVVTELSLKMAAPAFRH